ncbi:MAG: DUF108 domain-containing protein [Bacteroidaceae bacterium]|nr:DUF108 domain-containing protein [Bacteroidaceae bacterium]
MKKLAIVGCGKLGSIVAEALIKGMLPEYVPTALYSRTRQKAEELAEKLKQAGWECTVCNSMEELVALTPDYIVEAASPAAMRQLALPALEHGCNIVTLSIGALADEDLYDKVKKTATRYGSRIYIVSGATGGFDVLQTATLMGNAKARFFNEKGPNALKGTPVYEEQLQEEQHTVFQGTATEAIAMFPTKVNVTVAASRASVGPEQMQVTMLSTPGFKGDTQRVEIENDQVHAVIDVYSATAEIAGWSVVNTLRNIVSPIVFC